VSELGSSRALDGAVLCLPLAALALHHGAGHGGDLAFFHQWYLAFREGPSFYATGPGLNYPILGVLLVCGPARLVDLVLGAPLSLEAFVLVHKASLAIGECAWIAAGASLAARLGHARPWLAAGLAYLAPSSWATGAYFGQIDVWGSALVLALLAATHALVTTREARARASVAVIGLATLVLLEKPLAWLALPSIAVWLVLARGRIDPRAASISLLVALLAVLAIDAVVAWPFGIASHVVRSLTMPGSAHADLAVAGGASLWSFFFRSGVPSRTVLVGALDVRAAGVTLFSMVTAATLVLQARALRALGPSHARALVPSALAAGLVCLAGAYLLPGSHERYLVHALPPLLFVALAPRAIIEPGALGPLIALTAFLCGAYVVASISWASFDGLLAPLRGPVLLGIAQPALGGLALRALASCATPRAEGVP